MKEKLIEQLDRKLEQVRLAMNRRRKKKMTIKCPFCGSENYECYDRVGDGTFEPVDLCVCENCDKQFQIVYTVSRIEKES